MSWTGTMTEQAKGYAEFKQSHEGKAGTFRTLTSLGTARNPATGAIMEFWGCPQANEVSQGFLSGSGAPKTEQVDPQAWLKAHASHALTHLGAMIDGTKMMDNWYCQTDHSVCYGTV